MHFEGWIVFFSIALLATVTPGPAALLVSTHSLTHGYPKAINTIFGNISGLLLMSGISVLGLSAVVLNSAVAFTVLKVAGAIYLICMGINLWRKGIAPIKLNQSEDTKNRHLNLYLQDVLVSLTNPKAIVFTTALFPQFIDPSKSLLSQFVTLVMSFTSLSFICLSGYAWLAQRARYRASTLMSRIALGSTFVGAGVY